MDEKYEEPSEEEFNDVEIYKKEPGKFVIPALLILVSFVLVLVVGFVLCK
jgi:hypothetical protein